MATASTCVADPLIVGLGAPIGEVPFGLAHHEFNPSRNRRIWLERSRNSVPGRVSREDGSAKPVRVNFLRRGGIRRVFSRPWGEGHDKVAPSRAGECADRREARLDALARIEQDSKRGRP